MIDPITVGKVERNKAINKKKNQDFYDFITHKVEAASPLSGFRSKRRSNDGGSTLLER